MRCSLSKRKLSWALFISYNSIMLIAVDIKFPIIGPIICLISPPVSILAHFSFDVMLCEMFKMKSVCVCVCERKRKRESSSKKQQVNQLEL